MAAERVQDHDGDLHRVRRGGCHHGREEIAAVIVVEIGVHPRIAAGRPLELLAEGKTALDAEPIKSRAEGTHHVGGDVHAADGDEGPHVAAGGVELARVVCENELHLNRSPFYTTKGSSKIRTPSSNSKRSRLVPERHERRDGPSERARRDCWSSAAASRSSQSIISFSVTRPDALTILSHPQSGQTSATRADHRHATCRPASRQREQSPAR